MQLTKEQMSAKLKSIGLLRGYKPMNDESNIEREPGHEIILFECRRPSVITDGVMTGVAIDLYSDEMVRVWTSQKTKAAACARAHGFKVKLLEGEAELYIPIARADEFLHDFGAKVKKRCAPPPPEASAKGRAKMAASRATQDLNASSSTAS